MAYWKKKQKKPIELSAEEKEHLKEALALHKKFFKPLKGEIVVKRSDCQQPWIMTARYFNEDDMKKDAIGIVERLNSLDKGKRWTLVSINVIQKTERIEDEDGQEAM